MFDELLEGGYEPGIITTVYGPAGSGKSNLMLLAVASTEGKVLFVDTEGSFSVDRLMQLAPDVSDVMDRAVLLRVSGFEQQAQVLSRLAELAKDVDLIIVDGIATQYRAALARNVKDVNNELSKQVNALYSVASDRDIPVLMTSQVYADMEGDGVKVVGGDIIKYSSKCMIELRHEGDEREAVLVRHRSLPSGRSRRFVIENVGIYEAK